MKLPNIVKLSHKFSNLTTLVSSLIFSIKISSQFPKIVKISKCITIEPFSSEYSPSFGGN